MKQVSLVEIMKLIGYASSAEYIATLTDIEIVEMRREWFEQLAKLARRAEEEMKLMEVKNEI